MIEFQLPWVFLLLPLPWLAWRFLRPAPEGGDGALRVPFYAALRALPSSGRGASRRSRAVAALKVLAWVLLVTAAAQPTWMGDPRATRTEGRDLMLALDLSGSMARDDFTYRGRPVDRFAVVRAVAQDFVARREGDRVGLVLFGTRAYLQAPLTFDRETVIELLGESEVGLAGEETAIGDAIALAVKHLRRRPADERVLVLLSDGASNAGVHDPLDAAEVAAREGVRIYTIGVGAGPSTLRTPLGALLTGDDLDEKTLASIAKTTGGAYFRARDTQGLVDVYRQIDQLEATEGDAALVRPSRALFIWPLGLAMALVALMVGWRLAAAHAPRGRDWLPDLEEAGPLRGEAR